MRLVVQKQNVGLVLTLRDRAQAFASGAWKVKANRAVVDAGRKTKTQVQRSVRDQMGLAPGQYQSYVTANTRGIPCAASISYEIFGVKGGQRIEIYKGLRVLKLSGAAAGRMNAGRGARDQGAVQSGVWNNPRVFKRSFASNGGFFAMLPGSSTSRAPQAFWTYGLKPNQPRHADGKFGKSNVTYGRVRRLAGPSLIKEIPKGASLATFHRVAPVFLEQAALRHLSSLVRF